MSLKNNLIRSSALNGVQKIVSVVVTLLIMPFIIHHLGDHIYGYWVIMATIMGYYAFLDFGITPAVARFLSVAEGRKDELYSKQIINTSLIVVLALDGIVVFLGFVFYLVLPIWTSGEDLILLRYLFLVSLLSLVITFPSRIFGSILISHVRQDLLAVIRMARVVLHAALIWGLFSLGQGIYALAWITCMLAIVADVTTIFAAFKIHSSIEFRFSKYCSQIVSRELLGYGFGSFLGSLADLLRWNTVIIVAGIVAGSAIVTHFNIALFIGRHGVTIIMTIFSIFMPVFGQLIGRGDERKLKTTFYLALMACVPSSVWIFSGFIVFGDVFIQRWMGTNYSDAYIPLCILSVGLLTAMSQNPVTSIMQGLGLAKAYAVTNMVEGIFNAVLCVCIGYKLKLIGLALAVAIPMVVVKLALQPLVILRFTKWSRLEYYRNLLTLLIKSIFVAVCCALLVYTFLKPSYMNIFATGCVYSCVYCLGVFFFVWRKKDRRAIFEHIQVLQKFESKLLAYNII